MLLSIFGSNLDWYEIITRDIKISEGAKNEDVIWQKRLIQSSDP